VRKAHWDVPGAIEFTTVEICTHRGLVTVYLLFVMELKIRRVHAESGRSLDDSDRQESHRLRRRISEQHPLLDHGPRHEVRTFEAIQSAAVPVFDRRFSFLDLTPFSVERRPSSLTTRVARQTPEETALSR
jgi:hypothetical protein